MFETTYEIYEANQTTVDRASLTIRGGAEPAAAVKGGSTEAWAVVRRLAGQSRRAYWLTDGDILYEVDGVTGLEEQLRRSGDHNC